MQYGGTFSACFFMLWSMRNLTNPLQYLTILQAVHAFNPSLPSLPQLAQTSTSSALVDVMCKLFISSAHVMCFSSVLSAVLIIEKSDILYPPHVERQILSPVFSTNNCLPMHNNNIINIFVMKMKVEEMKRT